ncbi:hypothetical protein [Terribacillus saccharophilus]|uniref:hypothetical protein n=1 Tax=Terribacillus saccharophilus TaxID=361277 RepID=UPI003D2C9928
MLDGILEIFKTLFPTMYTWTIAPFLELRTIKGLIYGRDGDVDLAFGIFQEEELTNIYTPGMNMFVVLAVSALLIAIALGGMKISSSGINPSNRTYAIEFMKDLAIVGIVFFNLSTLYTIIFGINYTIVELFAGGGNNAEIMEVKESIPAGEDVIGQIIIGLCLLGLSIWANFYYMMRKLTLIIFMIIGPLMVVLYLIPQTKKMTMAWFSEFVGTVFVQSVHAALYWIIALLAAANNGLETIILYVIFIPVSESLRSLLGLGGGMNSAMSKAGAMFGMSGLAGIYGATKGALEGKSVTGALKGAYQGTKDKLGKSKGENGETDPNTLAANTGTDSGSTTRAEKMLKAGDLMSRGGKAVFGAAGSIAGSTMGPSGSILGSTIGYEAGGIAGGLVGRSGAAGAMAVGSRLKKGWQEGLQTAKDKMDPSKSDEQLAEAIAENDTTKWANANKEQFMNDLKEKFPDSHESSLNQRWDEKLGEKKAEHLASAREQVGKIRANDGKYANANSLSAATTDQLSQDWASKNREQFVEDFDKNNPVVPGMSSKDLADREEKKELEWNNAVANKREQIAGISKSTAGQMSNGLPAEQAFINKSDYAKAVSDQVSDMNKSEFKDRFMKNNPAATDEQAEEAFQSINGDKSSYAQVALAAVSGLTAGKNIAKQSKVADADELVNATTAKLTNNWAANNKQAFMDNYDRENPITEDMTEQEKATRTQQRDAAWNNAVTAKSGSIKSMATSVAANMTSANPGNSSLIDKNNFANGVSEEVFNADQAEFKKNYKASNPGASEEDVEVAFKEHNGSSRGYFQMARGAADSVKSGTLYSGNQVNNDYLASQMASIKTGEAKASFIKQQEKQGVTTEAAEQAWQAQEPNAYKQNLKEVSQQIPSQIPINGAFSNVKAINGAAAIGSGVLSGVGAATGVKDIAAFARDTKLGKVVSSGMQGAGVAYQEAVNNPNLATSPISNAFSAVSNGISGGIAAAKTEIGNTHIPQNLEQRQANYTNAVSFVGGVVGGVRGYQAASKLGVRTNPYNADVNQKVMEVSEVEHMAQKTQTPNGNKEIAKGAVQLVTTGNKSFVQVKDIHGQKQVVSRYGSGDSSLKKGEVVYQDLNVSNGALVHDSTPYKLDSTGGRIETGRPINVKPASLLANRAGTNSSKQPSFQEVPALNQQVDSGELSYADVVQNTKDIRMVVSKGRSYMVAKDNSGQEFRVSPYGKGDGRLDADETVQINYSVENKRLVRDLNASSQKYFTSARPEDLVRPEELLPPVVNNRLQRRRDYEELRHQSMGGAI